MRGCILNPSLVLYFMPSRWSSVALRKQPWIRDCTLHMAVHALMLHALVCCIITNKPTTAILASGVLGPGFSLPIKCRPLSAPPQRNLFRRLACEVPPSSPSNRSKIALKSNRVVGGYHSQEHAEIEKTPSRCRSRSTARGN